jgi:two-component system response regulator
MVKQGEAQLTILLVDDDDDCRMLVRDAIAECKVKNSVREARNGEEALRYLRQIGKSPDYPKPELIYLDIEMPQLDGISTLQQIKADPQLRNIPVVMMTGVSDENRMRKAAEFGANSYTIKPADAEQFLRTVLASTNYWLHVHQYPEHHLPSRDCRR